MNNAHEREQAADARAHYAEHQLECVSLPTLIERAECIIDKSATTYDQKHTHQDLRAQQDVAGATIVLMVMGVLGLIASMVGIALVYENLGEMRRQSSIQKEVGENQVKAYLWVSEASLHIRNPNAGKGLLDTFRSSINRSATIILKVVNNGQTPALDITASATLSASKFNQANAFAMGKPPRFTAKSTQDSKVDAVMAGDEEPGLYLFFPFESEDEVANAFSTDWAVKYGVENIHISGTVTYKDVFGHTYESEFAFNGLVKDSDKFEAMHRVKRGKVLFLKIKDASDEPESSGK